ncbi:thioredoxin domain-containing protein [Streptomyces sp. HUAS MG47]|uniref:thioredoxin domain-containing protein n=1 Tax=Streptomyces solicamelliae TaxID=3231716 RepID=UPI003877A833
MNPADMDIPAQATGAGGSTLSYGNRDAPHTVHFFLELRDRGSARVMESLLDTVRKGADAGTYVLAFHFAGMMDDTVGGSGSRRALSALGAAADAGPQAFADYLAALFAAQPFPPGYDRFAEADTLLAAADGVAGLRSPDFDRKVNQGTYLHWAGETIAHFESYGVVGTPVAWYDDDVVQVLQADDGPAVTPQDFLSRLPG